MGRAFRCTLLYVVALWSMAPDFALSADESENDKKRIEYLIELLASKNVMKEEIPRLGATRRSYDGYDCDAQGVVYLAGQQLVREGAVAFDALLAHSEDRRYSYSYEGPNGEFVVAVSGACYKIVKRAILCYEAEIPLLTSAQHRILPWGDGELKAWWEKNRTRELWELQIEAIDQQLAFQKSVKYEDAPPIFRAASKMPPDEFEKIRKDAIAKLERLRAGIAASHTPHFADPFKEHLSYFRRLPWPTPIMYP